MSAAADQRHTYAGFNGRIRRDDVNENCSPVLNPRNAFASCEQGVSVEVFDILRIGNGFGLNPGVNSAISSGSYPPPQGLKSE